MKNILLWGLSGEPPLELVKLALQRRGITPTFIDQRQVLDTYIDLHISATVGGQLATSDGVIDLDNVSAVYIRPYPSTSLPTIARKGPRSKEWEHACLIDELLYSWSDGSPARVVNRPLAMSCTTSSKLFQLDAIRSVGLRVPETVVTTDMNAVLQFRNRYGTIIYKSCSGVRSQVSRLSDEKLKQLENVMWCPTQFQQYVHGIDYRVHVVGSKLYTCMISCDGNDYRYAKSRPKITPATLPVDIGLACHNLATKLGLPFTGIDLRRTPEGKWYCFEINPSPGFSFYEEITQQPISEALAQLLLMENEDK